jgi:phosphoribosylanthranilate isomerase
VQLCLELGVERLGFVLAPSKRRVELSQLEELAPSAGGWTAVLVDPGDQLVEAVLGLGCGWLQFHGQESPADCARWRGRARVVKALKLDHRSRLEAVSAYADAVDELLFDAPQPGQGQTFDWSWLAAQTFPLPFFLAGGLHADNVERAIRLTRPAGVDVSSGVEAAPGLKCEHKLRRFVERTRQSAL